MSERQPEPPQTAPYEAAVEEGRNYWWCSCGRSAKQPFCDGAHQGTAFSPVKYTAHTTGTVWFCGCKRTAAPPLCDGTHKKA
jgi:CDGSH-type Zn-finger protein